MGVRVDLGERRSKMGRSYEKRSEGCSVCVETGDVRES